MLLRLETLIDFWILAILVGTSQGGLQALSRSYFGRLVPKNDSSEFLVSIISLGSFPQFSVPLLLESLLNGLVNRRLVRLH